MIDSEKVMIHDILCLINIMFMDETIEMLDACGRLATIVELCTSQVGTNSPFWFMLLEN
jgi:hypothetical protein